MGVGSNHRNNAGIDVFSNAHGREHVRSNPAVSLSHSLSLDIIIAPTTRQTCRLLISLALTGLLKFNT